MEDGVGTKENLLSRLGKNGDHAIRLSTGDDFLRANPGIHLYSEGNIKTVKCLGDDLVKNASGLPFCSTVDEWRVILIIHPVKGPCVTSDGQSGAQ